MTISKIFGVEHPSVYEGKNFVTESDCTYPDLVMGIEVEAEQLQYTHDIYRDVMNPWLRVVEDGSLRGTNVGRNSDRVPGMAWEFLPRPMQMKKLLPAINELYTKAALGPNNFSDRTSMHVHVNYTDKTTAALRSLAAVYPVIEDVLFEFVGIERATNNYCIPWKQSIITGGLIKRLTADPTHAAASWQKYSALNLCPLSELGTVEFRHMGGCGDVEVAKKWINIIGSLIKFTDSTNEKEIVDLVNNLNNYSQYEGFFRAVFGDTLPYDDKYRESLESGVLMSKYSTI